MNQVKLMKDLISKQKVMNIIEKEFNTYLESDCVLHTDFVDNISIALSNLQTEQSGDYESGYNNGFLDGLTKSRQNIAKLNKNIDNEYMEAVKRMDLWKNRESTLHKRKRSYHQGQAWGIDRVRELINKNIGEC